MKITAPEKLDNTVLESAPWKQGGLYIALSEHREGDFTNPFLCAKSHNDSFDSQLIRLEDGMMMIDTESTDRGNWVDVTGEFELMHAEYV